MEEINQNPTLSTMPKRITFLSLRKLFLILAGVLFFLTSIVGAYWLGRLQTSPQTVGVGRENVEEIPVCQQDSDCVLAIDLSAVCCGVGVYSKEQLQRNKNLVPYAEYEKNKEKYRRPDSGVVCKICSPIPEAVICDRGVFVNSCRAATKIEAELSYEARKAVSLAKEDLAKNLIVDIHQISFLRAQEQTWGNTSLGCSKEGFMYTEVITTGWQIFLQAYSVVYDYRVSQEESVVSCQSGNQLAKSCTQDSDCPTGLVCIGRGPARPSAEIPGVCLSQKQGQAAQ